MILARSENIYLDSIGSLIMMAINIYSINILDLESDVGEIELLAGYVMIGIVAIGIVSFQL